MTHRSPASRTPAERPPVIVIGAHRSGTTATVGALQMLGLQVGQRLDSHHESKAMQRLHETYLKKVGASWHNPVPFLASVATREGEHAAVEYLQSHLLRDWPALFGYRNNARGWWQRARLKRGAPWGWKEPRTTLFAFAWLQIFPDATVIDIVRHPLAVAMSIRQRELRFRSAGDAPKVGLEDLDYCMRLALTYVEAGEKVAPLTRFYRRVQFEVLQNNPEAALAELATYCRLESSPARIRQAAQSIRPPSTPSWPDLGREEAEKLLAIRERVTKLGYDLPFGVTAATTSRGSHLPSE